MQNAFGLLPHTDLRSLTGASAPALWRLSDSDTNAYAVGDVVVDSLQSAAGAPVVQLYGGVRIAAAALARSASLLRSLNHEFGVVVGVAPASPFDVVQPAIAAGGGVGGRLVWVIPGGAIQFDVVGDGATPSRGEFVPDGLPALNLTAQGLEVGGVTASLVYSPPTGSVSGTALAGGSFNLTGAGELAVDGLAPNVALAPHALYRVRLRTPSPQGIATNPVVWRQSADGL